MRIASRANGILMSAFGPGEPRGDPWVSWGEAGPRQTHHAPGRHTRNVESQSRAILKIELARG